MWTIASPAHDLQARSAAHDRLGKNGTIGESAVKLRHLEIQNFRGIKNLSWRITEDFNCLIGPGDTGKSTILTAIDYALSPRNSLPLDDSDFFDQNVDDNIVIQATLSDWDETRAEVKALLQESRFGQWKCGITDDGPVPEPESNGLIGLSVCLTISKSLEPEWYVVRGRHDPDNEDSRKQIRPSDRAVLGASRIEIFSDFHFTWGRNSILTRLSSGAQTDLNEILSVLARETRAVDISGNAGVAACQSVADSVRDEAITIGVRLGKLSPRIDVQRQPAAGGIVSLHESVVPLRTRGSGSKRLVAAAMQMKLYGGKCISLIDEIEIGLEPHRIRGLICKLRRSGQQVFMTTHSPVVTRELKVDLGDLHVIQRDNDGRARIENLSVVHNMQAHVRKNAEAFLGSRIVVCEGPTEVGCLRALDSYKFETGDTPVWSLAASYFCGSGGGDVKTSAPKLKELGYDVAIFCDNDAPDQIGPADLARFEKAGIHVCHWDARNATEHQLFADMPWIQVPKLLETVASGHDTMELASLIDLVIKDQDCKALGLGADPSGWPESAILRGVLGKLAHQHSWFKRIDYAENVFQFSLPLLPSLSTTMERLEALWAWMQRE